MTDPASQFEKWVEKAEEDRLCILNNLASAAIPWGVVCFHAQQGAEKYLKAFLVFKRAQAERTHDLEHLLKMCVRHDASLRSLSTECEALTAYAVDSRYPDVLTGDLEKMAREAVRMSDTVCTAIRARLGC